ncbi:PRC-barrel domain-containing protein [Candidatus Micrarchaeota archaeon]|nr:PRC-barrel domain-containing protein [Candidatus Micrarchaeota archaeon]
MAIRLSKIYDMDIYTDGGKYLGRVRDIILDLEKGEIHRITLEPLNFLISKEEWKRIITEKSILYKSVRSVEDVVVVTEAPKKSVA